MDKQAFRKHVFFLSVLLQHVSLKTVGGGAGETALIAREGLLSSVSALLHFQIRRRNNRINCKEYGVSKKTKQKSLNMFLLYFSNIRLLSVLSRLVLLKVTRLLA